MVCQIHNGFTANSSSQKYPWQAEVYTKGPEGQTGWDIEQVEVTAATRKEAKVLIAEKVGDSFDCIITLWNGDYC